MDVGREKVIDDIFASLPYKTKTNEKLKDLQKQMHEVFRKKHQEKRLEQKVSNRLQKLKEKTKTNKIEDIPHLKIQILRTISADNLGKPKRSEEEKELIKSVVEKVIQNTKS